MDKTDVVLCTASMVVIVSAKQVIFCLHFG